MDKTKHPAWLIVLTYAVMAFSRAGRDSLSFKEMIICGISGIVLGIIVVIAEKLKLPTYVGRGIAAFFAAAFIIQICVVTMWTKSDIINVITAMIPPVAAGAMFVEGLCLTDKNESNAKILTAVYISAFLALSVFVAVQLAEWKGVAVIGPIMR